MPAPTAYTLADLFANARASKRTVVNGVGALAEVASGVTGLTFDRATLRPLGILVEGASTNLVANARAEGATSGTPGNSPTLWNPPTTPPVASGTTVQRTIQSIAMPIGNAIRYTFSGVASAAGFGTIYFTRDGATSTVGGTAYSVSAYLATPSQPQNVRSIFLTWKNRNAAGPVGVSADTAITDLLTPDLRRLTSTKTTPADGTEIVPGITWYVPEAGPWRLDLIVYAPQLEADIPTSTIFNPAGSAVATARLADVIGLDLAKAGFANAGSSLVVTGRVSNTAQASRNRGIIRMDDGTDSNYLLSYIAPGGAARVAWAINGVLGEAAAGSVTDGQEWELRLAFRAGQVLTGLNGAAVREAVMPGLPFAMTRLRLGSAGVNGDLGLNGTIRRLAIYPRAVTAAELPTLAA